MLKKEQMTSSLMIGILYIWLHWYKVSTGVSGDIFLYKCNFKLSVVISTILIKLIIWLCFHVQYTDAKCQIVFHQTPPSGRKDWLSDVPLEQKFKKVRYFKLHLNVCLHVCICVYLYGYDRVCRVECTCPCPCVCVLWEGSVSAEPPWSSGPSVLPS